MGVPHTVFICCLFDLFGEVLHQLQVVHGLQLSNIFGSNIITTIAHTSRHDNVAIA